MQVVGRTQVLDSNTCCLFSVPPEPKRRSGVLQQDTKTST